MRRLIAITIVVATAAAGSLAIAAPAGAQASPLPAKADVLALIGSIPASQRDHCQLTDPATEGKIIAGEVAAIRVMARCYNINDFSTLWYILMDSPDSTTRLYHTYAGTYDPATPYRDEDAQCPGETTWGFGDKKDDGMLACYYAATNLDGTPHDESAVLVWSYTAGKILGLAETANGTTDASALKKWWRDEAGPLSHPGRVTGIADWTARDRDAEKTLLSHVPKSIRGTCVVKDRSADGAFAGARLWTNAVVTCKSGLITLAYGAMNPTVVENFVDEFTPVTEGEPCPASGTWSAGKGKQRHTVGNYACFVQANADGTQTAWMIWAHRKLGIAATAAVTTTNDDAAAVYKWWQGDSGPV
jgi:hypothetical protein